MAAATIVVEAEVWRGRAVASHTVRERILTLVCGVVWGTGEGRVAGEVVVSAEGGDVVRSGEELVRVSLHKVEEHGHLVRGSCERRDRLRD